MDAHARLLLCMFLFALVLPGTASASPVSHITENLVAFYYPNGTLIPPVSRTGTVSVDVNNVQDVMQYIKLNLSGTENTNLQSVEAYAAVAASPNPGDRTRVYVNTTNGPDDMSYQITNTSVTPLISIRLDTANTAGGKDIYAGDTNTLFFNLTMNPSTDLPEVKLVLQFRKDVLGGNDAVNLFGESAPFGNTERLDTDYDGVYDRITWTADLPKETDSSIIFYGNITPGVNFDEGFMYVNLDSWRESRANFSQSQTFTGITFSGRFSKGPVRQGVEMVELGTWLVRGFLKNMASGLDYVVHGWEIYRIGESDSVLNSTATEYLSPGETLNTEWYNTGSGLKQNYYSSSFDWEVAWGGSQYRGESTSYMELPVIYEIDSFTDMSGVIQSNSASGTSVRITDSVTHLGHASLGVDSVKITSLIPNQSVNGTGREWSVSGVTVYYSNASGQYDITPESDISFKNADTTPGFVDVNISNITYVLGHAMEQNDDIILYYTLSSAYQTSNEEYVFNSTSVIKTVSGTPVSKQYSLNLTVPGVSPPEVPPPGGGGISGGAARPSPIGKLVKESASITLVSANTAMVNVTYAALDSGDKGIRNVGGMIYIPAEGKLDESRLGFRVFRKQAGMWKEWKRGEDYRLQYNGVKRLASEDYYEYLIAPIGDVYGQALDLYDGDRVEIYYVTEIPVGTSEIVTRLFGQNYYVDRIIFEDVYLKVRREQVLEKLRVTESEWVQGQAQVGRPVKWVKTFSIQNPNNVSVEEAYRTPVFDGTLSAGLAFKGKREPLEIKKDSETYVNWHASLGPGQTGVYRIEITTPPVLNIKENVTVIEATNLTVTFEINITLKNFAGVDYFNISLEFPIKNGNVLLMEGNGVELFEEGSSIVVRDMKAGQTAGVRILYTERPPVIITTMGSSIYGCNEEINISVFVIPSEKEASSYLEMEIMGPKPSVSTLYANMYSFRDVSPEQRVEIPLGINSAELPPGKHVLLVRFRKDFGTLLSSDREFEIDCETSIVSIGWVYVVLVLGAAAAVMLLRVHRRRSARKEMEELKRKVKSLG